MSLLGIGYDSHRLAAGRRLVIGGVEIPHERGLEGHSDADVLAHAITDALLGAAGLGDIGAHFPDTDERWRGADSIELLRQVVAMLDERGLRVGNVDCTVVMEAPKLAPHRDAIRARLAGALAVSPARVNVKASTGEGIGFVGRGESGAFIADGNTRKGGRLPMNTNGGGLSYTHTGMYGMFAIQEAVRQLRGQAAVQVPGVTISFVQGVGMFFGAAGSLVLSNRRP